MALAIGVAIMQHLGQQPLMTLESLSSRLVNPVHEAGVPLKKVNSNREMGVHTTPNQKVNTVFDELSDVLFWNMEQTEFVFRRVIPLRN